ncbi:M24 family metallopeptidase [Candidatus Foliamicus sp.]
MLLNRERAMELMEREGLDALIAVTPNNVLYLSDFDTDFLYDVPWVACAILPRDPDIPPCLVATEIEAAVLVQRPSWMPDQRLYYFGLYGGVLKVHTFAEDTALEGEDLAIRQMVAGLEAKPYAGIAGAVCAMLSESGLDKGRLGFDDTRFAGVLGDAVAQAEVVDAGNLLIEIRMVKTPDEITILKQAAVKNEAALRTALAAIREGATWNEVYTAYEVAVVEQGAHPFATFNGAGPMSAGAGRPERDYVIQPGDQVCFDSMMKWRRYMGDAQRTAVLGEASPKMERYWRAYAAGIQEAYSQLRPGIQTGELRDRVIRAVRAAGLPSFTLAFTHGIGLDHIEVPFIAGGNLGDFRIEENMVLNIDMELHEIGWGGMFFEESMRITANGAERLYTLERDLIRL